MSKYDRVISEVFDTNHVPGEVRVSFGRDELAEACERLGIRRIKNLGDIPYAYRFRRSLPLAVQERAPEGSEWVITGDGIARYQFRLAAPAKIEPSQSRAFVKVPDATPEIVRYYAPGTDEQALLTRVRYNRLVDLFTGIASYSVQNHLRTTVTGIGQIEVDEIYVGLNRHGVHFVMPCQAKSPGDRFGLVQVQQDMQLCSERFPNAVCRPLAIQFLGENDLAMLELTVEEQDDLLRLAVVDERHFRLIPRDQIDEEAIAALRREFGHAPE